MKARTRLAGLAVAGLLAGTGLSASAYVTATDSTTALVEVTTLGVPGASASFSAGKVTVTVTAPASGPAPTSYTVSKAGVGPLCTLASAGICVDPATIRPPTALSYTVTARLGTEWSTTTAPVPVDLAPLPATVSLSSSPTGGSDTGLKGDGIGRSTTPTFTVRAPKGDAPYVIRLVREDGIVLLPSRTVLAGVGFQNITAGTPAGKPFTRSFVPTAVTPESTFPGSSVPLAPVLGSFTPAPLVGPTIWPLPSVESVALASGDGTAGQAGPGDSITITFSQPMLPSSFCTNWVDSLGDENVLSGLQLAMQDSGGVTGGDRMYVTAPPDLCDDGTASDFRLGSVDLGADYRAPFPGGLPDMVLFDNSTAELDSTWKVLTVTLGDPSVNADLLSAEVGPGTPGYASDHAPAPQDQAGNSLTLPIQFTSAATSGF